MPAHDIQQMPGLGIAQPHRLVPRFPDGVLAGPAALRLVDHHHTLRRAFRRMRHVMIAEFRQWLNHRHHIPPRLVQPNLTQRGVARERLPQHVHERRISRQKNPAPRLVRERRIQSAQRFARAGNARHEQHDLLVRMLCRGNRIANGLRGLPQIPLIGASVCDFRHAMPRIQHACRLDDRRHRPVRPAFPSRRIQCHRRRADPAQHIHQHRAQRAWRASLYRRHAQAQQQPHIAPLRGPVRHQHRHHGMRPAMLMEIEQIESVILGLPQRVRIRLNPLELQHQDRPVGQHHGVDPLAEPQDRIFQQHARRKPRLRQREQRRLQHADAVPPRRHLRRLGAAEMPNLLPRQRPENVLVIRRQEPCRRAGPERPHEPVHQRNARLRKHAFPQPASEPW